MLKGQTVQYTDADGDTALAHVVEVGSDPSGRPGPKVLDLMVDGAPKLAVRHQSVAAPGEPFWAQ